MPKKLLFLAAMDAVVLFAQRPSRELIERGRKEFAAACGFCHGPDATGARAPDLVRSALVSHDDNGDLLAPLIRSGRPDKGMPPLSLAAGQVEAITAFLHARAAEALHSSHVPSDYPEEKLLTGNARAGQAYFNGAGGCAACHSPTGDLAGVARKYSPLNLQARFLYPGGGRSAVTATATVTLASGKQVSGRLISIDDFDIAIRDAAGWYHSWPRDKVKVELKDPLAAHRDLLPKYTDADMHNLFAYLETLK